MILVSTLIVEIDSTDSDTDSLSNCIQNKAFESEREGSSEISFMKHSMNVASS